MRKSSIKEESHNDSSYNEIWSLNMLLINMALRFLLLAPLVRLPAVVEIKQSITHLIARGTPA